MDRRPQRQLWSGECYDSEPEEGQKPGHGHSGIGDISAVHSDNVVIATTY